MVHDLHTFFQQASDEIASEYQRIFVNAASDPGTAGDEGERNWAKLFQNWLPPTYHIATKGRLISQHGELSPQIDVVILKPGYPPRLREKAIWLAGGVAAAFECKNTLTAANIRDAVQRSLLFKNLFQAETGSPRKELKSSIFYGLLAHSHSWKAPNSSPDQNVSNALEVESLNVDHPQKLLDVLCVADLGIWKYDYIPAYKSRWALGKDFSPLEGQFDLVMSTFVQGTAAAHREKSLEFQPIGALVNAIVRHLAWQDHSLRDIANYYAGVNLGGMGHGNMRPWPIASVYSPAVATGVLAGRATSSLPWDEWSMTAGVM